MIMRNPYDCASEILLLEVELRSICIRVIIANRYVFVIAIVTSISIFTLLCESCHGTMHTIISVDASM